MMIRRHSLTQGVLTVGAFALLAGVCQKASASLYLSPTLDATSSNGTANEDASQTTTSQDLPNPSSPGVAGLSIIGTLTGTPNNSTDPVISYTETSSPFQLPAGSYAASANFDRFFSYTGSGSAPDLTEVIVDLAVLQEGANNTFSIFYQTFAENGTFTFSPPVTLPNAAPGQEESGTVGPLSSFSLGGGTYELQFSASMYFSGVSSGQTIVISSPNDDGGGIDPVPEPSSLAALLGLGGTGVVGLVWRRRRRTRRFVPGQTVK